MEPTSDGGTTGDDAAHLVQVLRRMQRHLSQALDRALAEVQISVDQWLLLHAVQASEEATMGDLAQRVGLSPATATRAVDALVDAALVYRHTAPGDRRRIVVALSEMGARHLAQADAIAASCVDAQPEARRALRAIAEPERAADRPRVSTA